MIKDELYDRGLAMRDQMYGPEMGTKALENVPDFVEKLQEVVTRHCFGDIWSRDDLGLRDRSLITVAMLVAMGRTHEIELQLKGAIANGVTPEEIRELLLHASLYCGLPAAVDGFRIAGQVLNKKRAGTVLFVGLGTMGWPMAANLVAAGRTVIAADADKDREKSFTSEFGCVSNRKQPDLAAVDAVVLMLPTSKIVREVLLNEDTGLARGLPDTAVIVDMSSSDPTDTIALGKDLAPRGIHVVDAPVSGGPSRAQQGTLTIMMGADNEDAAAVATDIVKPLSSRIFRTGALGSGHAMKALNNYVGGAAFTSAAEALIIGSHYGLTPEVMVEVLNASTGRSFMTENTIAGIAHDKYETGFALGLLNKDVRIAAQLAKRAGSRATVCDEVSHRLSAAAQSLGNEVDSARAYQHWKAVDEA
jgi:3-hydroxyisobutyrate dehydrogenase